MIFIRPINYCLHNRVFPLLMFYNVIIYYVFNVIFSIRCFSKILAWTDDFNGIGNAENRKDLWNLWFIKSFFSILYNIILARLSPIKTFQYNLPLPVFSDNIYIYQLVLNECWCICVLNFVHFIQNIIKFILKFQYIYKYSHTILYLHSYF